MEYEWNIVPIYKRLWFIIAASVSTVAVVVTIVVVAVLVSKKETPEDPIQPPNNETQGDPGQPGGNETQGDPEQPGGNETEPEVPIQYHCLDPRGTHSPDCLGGWMYSTNKRGAAYNAQWAKEQGWDYAFVTTYALEEWGKNLLKEHAIEFAKRGIAYHAMTLESQQYHKNPESGYNEVRAIIEYCKSENLTIAGIHIDYEPHALDEYNDDTKDALMQQYKQIIRNVANIVKPENLLYSAAVPWWWPAVTINGELTDVRGYDLVNNEGFDFVVPMLYDGAGNTAEQIIRNSHGYLHDNVSTVTGIRYTDHKGNFQNVLNMVTSNLSTDPKTKSNYLGVSIFANFEMDPNLQ
jgi:hypothetical protein